MGMFSDALKEYGLGSGEKLKLADGDNQIRVLSEPRFIQTMFKGNLTKKFVMWVIDRKDGKVKLFYAAKTIVDYLADLENNAFTSSTRCRCLTTWSSTPSTPAPSTRHTTWSRFRSRKLSPPRN